MEKESFWGEIFSTILSTAINSVIVYGLTSFSFLACVFFGWVLTMVLSTSNKMRNASKQLEIAAREIDEAGRRIEFLENEILILRHRLSE